MIVSFKYTCWRDKKRIVCLLFVVVLLMFVLNEQI